MENKGMVELYQPRHTLIGRDGIIKLPYFLRRLNAEHVLVVTDKGLIKTGTAGKVTAVLDDAKVNYVVYDGVEPNPSVRIVNEACFLPAEPLRCHYRHWRRFSHRRGKGGQYPLCQRRKDSGL